MRTPRLIPVLDLLGGIAVQAIGGDRANYRPVHSQLCPSAAPNQVARALITAAGARELYVADLSAIMGGSPQYDSLAEVHQSGATVWLDAGLSTVEGAAELAEQLARRGMETTVLIAGLETLAGPHVLPTLVQHFGADRLAFSLDLKHGQLLTASRAWPPAPRDVACVAHDAGVRRLILLDLAAVGQGQGPWAVALVSVLRQELPGSELIAGGGIRDLADIRALGASGCDAVLVASAIHRGTLALDTTDWLAERNGT